MKEDFLHYVWQYRLFSLKSLRTVNNEDISVITSGYYNRNTGPDFLNAQLKIDHQTWVGNVEIHLKSSDWYVHQHETDKNYDAVILHVVYENDVDVFMKNNQLLPTLELKNNIESSVFENYKKLFNKKTNWILCEKQILKTNAFLLENWKERLYFERLENKALFIKNLLQQSNNDFEAVLFWLLSKNFGLKVNGEAFLSLAKSLDFSIVKKERFSLHTLSALLFGQAGFLSENIEVGYFKSLQKEYEFLTHKYLLNPMAKNQFQFFRMRPANFPTVRIAQLISLYHKHQNLFSKLMNTSHVTGFYEILTVEVDDFWKTHYTFEKSAKKSAKRTTKSFIDLLIINTIIPLKFVYQQAKRTLDEEEILSQIKQIKPEKNAIISAFNSLNIKTKSAFDTQALLQLKNNYCDTKNCLQCAIGNSLLRTNK